MKMDCNNIFNHILSLPFWKKLLLRNFFNETWTLNTVQQTFNHLQLNFDNFWQAQVPHSQSSPRENPSFCKTLDLKIIHLKEMFEYKFHLISTIQCLAWPSKVKTTIYITKLCVLDNQKFTKKLTSKTQVRLWMRLLGQYVQSWSSILRLFF
jgi:hypothetical protein